MSIYQSTKSLEYYVYVYLREDGSPYYVGKGKGKRAWKKHRGHNPPKDKSRIIIWESNSTEAEAFALERRLIRWYGRKDNKTGILKNLTDGGEGVSGRVVTSETRAKISAANTGQKHTPEAKAKISAAKTDQKHTPEAKAKISAAKTGKNNPSWGRTTYELTDPEGNTYIVGGGFKKWCKDRNLHPGTMRLVALGKRKYHKGWTAKTI